MTPRQHTDFENDVKEYGPIGEKRLKSRLSASQKTARIYDSSDDVRFRIWDIDVIQLLVGFGDVPIERVIMDLEYNEPYGLKKYNTYEVKTDTYGGYSRNIVFEVMSNTNPGCLLRTRADYVYYVFLDAQKHITEEFLLETRRLKTWILHNFAEINRRKDFTSRYMDRGKDQTAILLISIETLINDNIAVKL